MKKGLGILAVILLLAHTLCFAEGEMADDDSGKDREQIYHLFNNVDLIPSTDIRYAKPRVVARMLYPKLQTEDVNENIDTFNTVVADALKEEYKHFREQVAEYRDAQDEMPSSDVKNDLNIDFDTSVIQADQSPIVSIRFTIRGIITGRKEPYRYHRVLNFDLDSGDEIELADLFQPDANYLEALSTYTKESLSRHLRNKQKITDGTAPAAFNFRNWNMKPYGLLITFDSDQVAPAIYGTQTVLIPYSALKDILEPDSPAAACLEHRKKCLRNNVLTGGFIDMAAKTNHRLLNPRLGKA